jgi:hypothetical protein
MSCVLALFSLTPYPGKALYHHEVTITRAPHRIMGVRMSHVSTKGVVF